MTKHEKALMLEARKSGERSIRLLLAETNLKKEVPSPSNPDYAQAFGIAQGLHLAGIYKLDPGRSDSEFQKIRDEVCAKAVREVKP